MSAVRRCSSSRPRGSLRCVERCCPSAAQARRSETCSCARTCSMQARRRAGLRSFPAQPPAEWAYPASDRKPPCATGCSQAQGPSGASPARSSAHRTPDATDNTSPRSRRSGGLRPSCSGPARPEHRPAATSRRSLQACIASLPLQSSLMSKTYLKSDHFNGGGSFLLVQFFYPTGFSVSCMATAIHSRQSCRWHRGNRSQFGIGMGISTAEVSAVCDLVHTEQPKKETTILPKSHGAHFAARGVQCNVAAIVSCFCRAGGLYGSGRLHVRACKRLL